MDKISIFCPKFMLPFFNPMSLLKSFKNPYWTNPFNMPMKGCFFKLVKNRCAMAWIKVPFSIHVNTKNWTTQVLLKVSKFQKQIFLFSFEPKNEQNVFLFFFCPKAELLQEGIFFPRPFICTSCLSNEKVRNRKNYAHFFCISFKSWILGGLGFFDF